MINKMIKGNNEIRMYCLILLFVFVFIGLISKPYLQLMCFGFCTIWITFLYYMNKEIVYLKSIKD